MSVSNLSIGEQAVKDVRSALCAAGIAPELRDRYERVLLDALQCGRAESVEIERAALMERGAKLAARYDYLVRFRPWRYHEIDGLERTLGGLVETVRGWQQAAKAGVIS